MGVEKPAAHAVGHHPARRHRHLDGEDRLRGQGPLAPRLICRARRANPRPRWSRSREGRAHPEETKVCYLRGSGTCRGPSARRSLSGSSGAPEGASWGPEEDTRLSPGPRVHQSGLDGRGSPTRLRTAHWGSLLALSGRVGHLSRPVRSFPAWSSEHPISWEPLRSRENPDPGHPAGNRGGGQCFLRKPTSGLDQVV